MKRRLLDLFCGRWGWSRAFAARGWKVVGVDLEFSPPPSDECMWERLNVLELDANWVKSWGFDFIVASSPCEQFSVHGMKHFHPNPPYPELGIKLFNHTRQLCESAGIPYVMENVRAAQQFVGRATHHCGPFYLWGTGVPLLMPQGIRKGISFLWGEDRKRDYARSYNWTSSKSKARKEATAKAAQIPAELANCVADYAERLLERVA